MKMVSVREMISIQPTLSCTVSLTLYSPVSLYACLKGGCVNDCDCPSPKSNVHLVILPAGVELSVKVRVSFLHPPGLLEVNAAFGPITFTASFLTYTHPFISVILKLIV